MRSRHFVAGGAAGLALVTAALLSFAAPAVATTAYPRAEGRCVDQVGVLGRELCAEVTAVLMRDEKATSDEIAVAVVPTTGEATIEEFSTGLFNAWGVGKKEKNNGVLLVVAVNDRTLRLETGRGMADRLSDDDAHNIIDTVITPRFASDEYASGILAGLDEVRRILGHNVPTRARLENLAGQAPAASGQETGTATDDATVTGDNGAGVASDGSWPADGDLVVDGGFPDDLDADGSPSIWAFVFGGGVILGLAFLVARSASSQSAGLGSGGTRSWQTGHRSGATRSSMSTTGTGWSSDSSSGSGASGSSFGGGSSDGGGASGSW